MKEFVAAFNQDGRTTKCIVFSEGIDSSLGKAVCSENDSYDMTVGIVIALCKALGVNAHSIGKRVSKVTRKADTATGKPDAKPGEVYIPDGRNGKYLKVVCRTEGGLLGVLESEAKVKPGVPENYVWWYEACAGMIGKEFVDSLPVWDGPHCGKISGEKAKPAKKRKRKVLCEGTTKHFYGVCGDKTPYKDCNGKPLVVGDLVTLDRYCNGKKKALPGLFYVVKTEADGPFVMTIAGCCDKETGKIKGFRVTKAKSWKEVEVGEYHYFIECVLEDAE